MLIEKTLFPVRPMRRDGESLAGFVVRHYGTNGHWMPEALHRAVGAVYSSGEPARRVAAWQIVGQVIGETTVEDKERWLDRPIESSTKKLNGQGWRYAPYTKVRICPACLDRHGFHLAIWELPFVRACPVHNITLTDECRCGRRLDWRSVGPGWTCRCGRQLANLETAQAGEAQLAMAMTVLASDGVNLPVSYWPDGVKALAHPPRDLSATYKNIVFLHGLRKLIAVTSTPLRKGRNFSTASVGRLLARWPDQFHRNLVRLVRFKCRNEVGLLVDITAASSLAQILNYLEDAAHCAELTSDLVDAASSVVSSVNAPVSARMRVIFHPRCTSQERERQLSCFATWWSDVAEMIDPTDPEDPSFMETTRIPPSFVEQMIVRPVVKALNMLVTAAVQARPVKAFRRVAMTWPPSDSVQKLQPMELMVHLTGQLEAISLEHLHHLLRLIEIAGSHPLKTACHVTAVPVADLQLHTRAGHHTDAECV